MYLKALEMQGFKSFPEKTRLTFEKDITAIVGPNGSGKSNISDAIRWVMGEQSSRSLRGGKMEDVIFGGTEKRKQVGFSEVSLIIDNTDRIFDMDNSEVMITRRYYRSSESEYYINKKSVRLKDIHEILMDTGLGREGYSIIDQGKIGEILSLKSIDRRGIFEEAAGISRFRHRKEESERKLGKTDENLIRINDKIAELEMQVEPLRKQSEVAKKYLLLRDNLREVEISLWMENLDKLKASTIKLEADYMKAREDLEKGQQELEELYKSAETFSERMQEKNLLDENIREEISGLESECSELENKIAVLNANMESNMQNIDRMVAELYQHDDRTQSINTQIKDRQDRIDEINGQKLNWEQEENDLNAKVRKIIDEIGDRSSELEGLIKSQGDTGLALAEKREKVSALSSTIQELYDRDDSLTGEMVSTKEKAEQAQSEFDTVTAELCKTEEEAKSLANIVSGHELRLRQRRDKVEKLKAFVTDLTLKHGSMTNRIKLLSDMEREYEGYSKAVKIVMREARHGVLKNIHGPVANLIRADDTYALAIETALGAASQNIIVDTPQDGKSAISYLKRTGGGRATFLPMSSIKANELREKGLESVSGFIGIAVNLVSYDEKYENIYKNLLGRTVIVHNIDDAINISKQFGYRFRIVTLDGQVINAGGSMSGGSVARNTGIISRANEIKNLRKEGKNLNAELTQKQSELRDTEKALERETYEIEQSRSDLRNMEDAVLQLRGKKAACLDKINDSQETCLSLSEETDTIKDRIEAATKEMWTLKDDIANLESESRDYGLKAGEITKNSEELEALRQEINQRLNTIQASVASLDAEQSAAQRSIQELAELSGSLTGDRDQKEQSIESIKNKNQSILIDIEKNKNELLEIEDKISLKKKELSAISAEKREMEAERTRSDKENQDKNRRILDLERACSRLEQKRLAAQMEEKQIVDRLWENYELTITSAEPIRQELKSISEATREVAKIKKEISALGTPNIGAIEEYERVNGRYTFLTEQRDDIQKAKDELEDIIGNITGEMEEIFAREFKRIAEEFKGTFTELFGGGKASLELEEESDILNCGIEIKAQPPGKSLKTITLLSGGEKAFTAIALYFSIQKIRPTPFCVMDEIEAALDEANVLRFAEYMRRLSNKTQFIVITHRRGTMEEADMLYGVTMQEQGVSKVIHVDVEEAEKTISAN